MEFKKKYDEVEKYFDSLDIIENNFDESYKPFIHRYIKGFFAINKGYIPLYAILNLMKTNSIGHGTVAYYIIKLSPEQINETSKYHQIDIKDDIDKKVLNDFISIMVQTKNHKITNWYELFYGNLQFIQNNELFLEVFNNILVPSGLSISMCEELFDHNLFSIIEIEQQYYIISSLVKKLQDLQRLNDKIGVKKFLSYMLYCATNGNINEFPKECQDWLDSCDVCRKLA